MPIDVLIVDLELLIFLPSLECLDYSVLGIRLWAFEHVRQALYHLSYILSSSPNFKANFN